MPSPPKVEIKVDKFHRPLCPECGELLRSETHVYVRNVPIYADEDGLPAPMISCGKRIKAEVVIVYCPTCDFSVDRTRADTIFTS